PGVLTENGTGPDTSLRSDTLTKPPSWESLAWMTALKDGPPPSTVIEPRAKLFGALRTSPTPPFANPPAWYSSVFQAVDGFPSVACAATSVCSSPLSPSGSYPRTPITCTGLGDADET